jgi:hypothetical protein
MWFSLSGLGGIPGLLQAGNIVFREVLGGMSLYVFQFVVHIIPQVQNHEGRLPAKIIATKGASL